MGAEYIPLTIVSISRRAPAGAECGAVIETIGIHGVRAAEEIEALAAEYGVRARQLEGRYDGRNVTGAKGVVLNGTRAGIESVWAAVQIARGKRDTALPENFDPRPIEPPAAGTEPVPEERMGSLFTAAERYHHRLRREGFGR